MKNLLYRNVIFTVLLSCFGTSPCLCANGKIQTGMLQELNRLMEAREEVMLERAKAQAYRILQEKHASSMGRTTWFPMRRMYKVGIIICVGGALYVLWKNWHPFLDIIYGLHNKTRGAIQGWLGVKDLEQGHTELKDGQKTLKTELSQEHKQILEKLDSIALQTGQIPVLLQLVQGRTA